ncbi:cytochrome C [Campylobacter porcelli]|uniref:Molybdopterin-containing oxidoreductase I, DMSO/TMAO/BSO reductase family, monoheme c-type cytochrome n=1 Tax=Campylobacter porcelli TaxID=1660073 RepID=A0A1X9SYN1_9BACT|nr:cytochrome C [Campylobacter sp. RM6137]ARR01407.1 molybdopterin-containing oxidoreductase I, DMSO/TMAO/BSO reductase family, monoheme c-type cytochrome [Campylobacter sp. RM6137]
MSKIILVSLILAGCLNAKILYSTTVKSVYLDDNSKDVAGKLLPTNAIEILQKSGDRVKFALKGYVNPSSPNVIYYSNGDRIIALSFAKTKTPKYEIIQKAKDGKFDEVRVVAYTTDDELENELKPMIYRAKQTYQESCSICHQLHKESQYNPNQWPSLFRSMLSRTPIDKKDEWLIIQYLQKASKGDIK